MAEFNMNEVAEVMQALQQRILTLEDALQRLPVVNQAHGIQQRLRPAKPDPFKGTSDSSRVRQWVFALELYYQLLDIRDVEKVPYAVSLMRENALLWWQSLDIENRPPNWDDFKQSLISYFQPVGAVTNAREKLARLTQQASVKNYVDTFRSICLNIPNMNAEEKMDRFKRGLKPEIRLQVAYAKPTDFETTVAIAEEIDAIIFNNRGLRYYTSNKSIPRREKDSVVPMELGAMTKTYVDAVKARGPRKERPIPRPIFPTRRFRSMDDTEKAILRERGLCFNCKKAGHVARFCPNAQGQ